MQWYYGQDGQPHGPVEFAVVRDLVASGQLGPDSLVWHKDMGANWMPVSAVPELNVPATMTAAAGTAAAVEKPRLHLAKREEAPVADAVEVADEMPPPQIRRRRLFGYS